MHFQEEMVMDPVCGMMVDPRQLAVEYLHMHFAFCSEQCRTRFLANPGLYIGRPGEKAPKQEGKEVIKRRRIRFAEPLPERADTELYEILCVMMGVKNLNVDTEGLEITYDLLQLTAEQIEEAMAAFGVQLGENWSDRLRRAWIYFEEERILSGMEVYRSGNTGSSCH